MDEDKIVIKIEKLYPTENTYNFIMVDVIDGRTWQVQWNIDDDKRLCYRIY